MRPAQDRYVEEHFVVALATSPLDRYRVTVRLAYGHLREFTMAGSGRLSSSFGTLEDHVVGLLRDLAEPDALWRSQPAVQVGPTKTSPMAILRDGP